MSFNSKKTYSFSVAMQRRDKLTIISDILDILRSKGPIRKTKLMNLANLNSKSFETYVEDLMVQLGLIDYRDAGGYKEYSITFKGLHVHNLLRALEKHTNTRGEAGEDREPFRLKRMLLSSLAKIGYSISSSAYIVGSSNISFFHDIILKTSNGHQVVIDIIDSSDPLEGVSSIGSILLSCADTDVVHLAFIPESFPYAIAKKAGDLCARLRIFRYSMNNVDEVARIAVALMSEPQSMLRQDIHNTEQIVVEILSKTVRKK